MASCVLSFYFYFYFVLVGVRKVGRREGQGIYFVFSLILKGVQGRAGEKSKR